jgi:hypothetical protein
MTVRVLIQAECDGIRMVVGNKSASWDHNEDHLELAEAIKAIMLLVDAAAVIEIEEVY